jgi:hypothetical protein
MMPSRENLFSFAAVRFVLWANALALFGIGTAALVSPIAFGAHVGGIAFTTPAALTDFRAVYGGLHYAIALTLWSSSRSKNLVRRGLLLALLAMGGLVFGRMVGVVANGGIDRLTFLLLLPELFGVALNGAVLWWSAEPQ